MLEQQIREDTVFILFSFLVTAMAFLAGCYLLFRKRNVFATGIKTSWRLRMWTAALFISIGLSNVWYLPVLFFDSRDDVNMSYYIGGLLDCLIVFPLAIIILVVMLQDRRRPLWPVAVLVAPLVAEMVMCIITRNDEYMPMARMYFLFLGIAVAIYIVREVKQYGRWLRDNYADLEHKEVWQSFVVMAIILFVFGIYVFGYEVSAYAYICEMNDIVLISYLMWRVETLSDLEGGIPQPIPVEEPAAIGAEPTDTRSEPKPYHENIGRLLQQYCIDSKLYLQHGLTLAQLSKAVGTNRFYLSQYFSSQGLTYNAYINDLRIRHFVSRYRESVHGNQPVPAQQLAQESGYRSYSTFSLAFKQRMGQSVTAWMRQADIQKLSA